VKKMIGKTWTFGDSISTTQIYPGQYLDLFEPIEIAKHAMEGVDPTFAKKVTPGDILVAGRNFGCGSSREQAVITLKQSGIQAIVAKSFARIFYRNAINQGVPPIISPQFPDRVKEGDQIEIDFEKKTLTNITRDYSTTFMGFPKFIHEILNVGGLVPFVRKRLGMNK